MTHQTSWLKSTGVCGVRQNQGVASVGCWHFACGLDCTAAFAQLMTNKCYFSHEVAHPLLSVLPRFMTSL